MAVIGDSCLLMGLCCLTFRVQAAFLGLARPSEMLRSSQGMKSVVSKSLSHATNAGHCGARSSASVPCRMQLQCVPTGKAVQNLFGAAQPATRRLSVSGRTRFQARSREISRVTSLQMHTAPVTSRDAQLVLAYARPLRKLMKSTQDAKEAVRSETVSVNTENALADLRKTLRLRFAFLADDDLDALILEHGRRRVTSDDDLARLIAEARRHEIAPVLRVIPSPHSSIAQASNRSKLAEKQARARAATPPSGPQQLLSFFSFRAKPFDDAELSGLESGLRQSLAALGVLGTIYLAPEGLNAQLSVPLSQLPQLRAQIASSEHLADVELNLGMQVEAVRAYRKLVVRRKQQVLTDGLPSPLDLQRAGTELEPEDWHAALRSRPDGALLLDCRNNYESELGSFNGAEPLDTQVFSESWSKLEQRLKDVPRDTPVMTFCTGGIRCVKVNAYLENKLGFRKTLRLRDGINGYLRFIKENPEEVSEWRGENFVFHEGPNPSNPNDQIENDNELANE